MINSPLIRELNALRKVADEAELEYNIACRQALVVGMSVKYLDWDGQERRSPMREGVIQEVGEYDVKINYRLIGFRGVFDILGGDDEQAG